MSWCREAPFDGRRTLTFWVWCGICSLITASASHLFCFVYTDLKQGVSRKMVNSLFCNLSGYNDSETQTHAR